MRGSETCPLLALQVEARQWMAAVSVLHQHRQHPPEVMKRRLHLAGHRAGFFLPRLPPHSWDAVSWTSGERDQVQASGVLTARGHHRHCLRSSPPHHRYHTTSTSTTTTTPTLRQTSVPSYSAAHNTPLHKTNFYAYLPYLIFP
ncbi:uncharacterized protein LOC123517404 [Portunus trituberculatus]|uniref:uncharacterized protein LOC123517404 n=1 Tax=Portunus trituberculatus TaxID=210409 RepID=UPI001E1CFB7E|nr:uncharacterized protein LOC123517404 [Portunus trituberculatus]